MVLVKMFFRVCEKVEVSREVIVLKWIWYRFLNEESFRG